MRATRAASILAPVFAFACGSSADYAPSGAAGDDSGGGVSFGGAQDIGQFRGILDSGGIPGPDTLDANGFFNEHFAEVPAAPCANTLCLTPGLSVGQAWLDSSDQMTLQIAVSTNVDPSTYTRLPMNLVVVVDTSGSMADDGRLVKVKVGLDQLIDNLQDTDRLAIVSFDDAATVQQTIGETLDRPALHAIVAKLQPGGGTNIFDGLEGGFELVGSAPEGHQNRVILLSDGNATVGDTVTDDIIAMSDGYVERGIGLTTIGVGLDFDVNLMRGLAEHGAGNFYFLEDATAATEVFTEELDYFLSPLATNVQITATPGLNYVVGDVVGSHLWSSTSDGGSMSIPAVFVASRTSDHSQGRRGAGSMIFMTVQSATGSIGGKVADIRLTYTPAGSTEPVQQTVSLAYETSQRPVGGTYLSGPEMSKRFAMYNMFLGFKAATETTYVNCAAAALNHTRAQAQLWNAEARDEDITADIGMIDQYLANLGDVGADVTVTDSTGCEYSNEGGGWEGGDYEGHQHGLYACSAGGSPAGLTGIALVLLVAIRRRRR